MQPDGLRKRSYPLGNWYVPPCFSDACLKGARQTGCVLGDKSHLGHEEASFFSSSVCATCGSGKPMLFEASFTVFFMVLICGFIKPDKEVSCKDAFKS